MSIVGSRFISGYQDDPTLAIVDAVTLPVFSPERVVATGPRGPEGPMGPAGPAGGGLVVGGITAITAGTGLSGGLITVAGTIALANTTVTPGIAGTVARFTDDSGTVQQSWFTNGGTAPSLLPNRDNGVTLDATAMSGLSLVVGTINNGPVIPAPLPISGQPA